tara:strand:- start:28 stop:177 length:150 start_codon:yes stop_codon:yes gene_type:complete
LKSTAAKISFESTFSRTGTDVNAVRDGDDDDDESLEEEEEVDDFFGGTN